MYANKITRYKYKMKFIKIILVFATVQFLRLNNTPIKVSNIF